MTVEQVERIIKDYFKGLLDSYCKMLNNTKDGTLNFDVVDVLLTINKELCERVRQGTETEKGQLEEAKEIAEYQQKCNDDELELNSELIKIVEDLKVYKKAYEKLSKSYCDKGGCYSNCECYQECIAVQGAICGCSVTQKHFLRKAR